MPRFRFNWSNLSATLLRDLAHHLDLEGDPADQLRRYYGARPRDEFIRDAWQVLLESWLAADREASRRAAHRLRERRVGDLQATDDLEYLRSLRNTSGLREVVLQLFIELGEQSAEDRALTDSLGDMSDEPIGLPKRDGGLGGGAPPQATSPRPAPGGPAGGEGPSRAGRETDRETDREEGERDQLMSFIGETVSRVTGAPAHIDDDGDFVVVVGSAVLFVSVSSDAHWIRAFSPLVRNVNDTPAVYPLLNGINRKLPIGRLVFAEGTIVLEHTLLPLGLSEGELAVVIKMLSSAADYFDHRIQEQLGGELMLAERANDEVDV